jgi:C-terminal processing protease CtpA/Prc
MARIPGPGPVRFTAPASVTVPAAARDRFAGPLVVLTGIHTVSAGEVLTLMLTGRRPAPVRIGEPTQGVFADELVRRLPNGWIFQLSSERYTDPAGRVYEGPGIAPDETVPVYPPDERDGQTDRALARARERLATMHSSSGRNPR